MSKKIEEAIDWSQLKRVLDYDPDHGYFIAKTHRGTHKPGKIIGGPAAARDYKGYVKVGIFGVVVLAHRLIWFYAHGYWPEEQIDHINHVRDDNRIANLRECTNAENRQNIRPEGYGASGYLGVYFHKERVTRPWGAMITIKGKYEHIGLFDTPEEASVAYLARKKELHYFATTGVSEVGGVYAN